MPENENPVVEEMPAPVAPGLGKTGADEEGGPGAEAEKKVALTDEQFDTMLRTFTGNG